MVVCCRFARLHNKLLALAVINLLQISYGKTSNRQYVLFPYLCDKNQADMPTCANCASAIAEKRSIACDSCKRNIHISCTGLQADDRLTRTRARCIKIVCNACSDNIEQLADLKAGFAEMKTSLMNKIEALEKKFSEVSTNVTSILSQTADRKVKEDIIQETIERISRSCNVVMRGIPEHHGSLEERKQHDSARVDEVLAAIDSSAKPIAVVRLGKTPTVGGGDSRPRPLKVVLPSRPSAVAILRNKNKLLDTQAYRNVTLSDDRTPAQIKFLDELRAELQRRTDDGEPDLTIRYMKGVPEIVKNTPKKPKK